MTERRKVVVYQCTNCGQKIYEYYTCPNCKSTTVQFVGPMEFKKITSDIKKGIQR